jgi:hypothetical protein
MKQEIFFSYFFPIFSLVSLVYFTIYKILGFKPIGYDFSMNLIVFVAFLYFIYRILYQVFSKSKPPFNKLVFLNKKVNFQYFLIFSLVEIFNTCFHTVDNSKNYVNYSYMNFLSALFYLFWVFFEENFKQFLFFFYNKKSYFFGIIMSSFIFSAIHINHFDYLKGDFFLYLFYFLIFFTLGFIWTFVSLNYGIIYSTILHYLYNSFDISINSINFIQKSHLYTSLLPLILGIGIIIYEIQNSKTTQSN